MFKRNWPFLTLIFVLTGVGILEIASLLNIPYITKRPYSLSVTEKVDPHYFFQGALISSQLIVVLLIGVIFWKLFFSIEKREFGDLSALWGLNLLYLLVAFWANCQNAFELNAATIIFRERLVDVTDIIQIMGYCVLIFRVKDNFRYRALAQKYRYVFYTLIPVAGGIFLYGTFTSLHALFLGIYVIRTILNSLVILFTGFILRNISRKYKGSSQFLFVGMIVYAAIQYLALFEIYNLNIFGHHYTTVGWILGLLSKLAVFWGLLQIFSFETYKSVRMEQILFRTFHELLNNLYGIKTPVNKIMSPNWSNVKPREEAKEIDNVFQTVVSIIDATKIVMKGEFKSFDFNQSLESDIDIVVSSEKSSISLNTLVEVSLIPIKEISGHDLKVVLDFGAGCEIICFRHEIIQVLVNLLKNAYESFSSQDGIIHITTRKRYATAGQDYNWVNITIEDTGPGISEDIQKDVFKEGYSTKGITGRGMGLTIVKEIIESKYGTLLLESPIKNNSFGTKFTIIFNKAR